jgi:hypothetical protein
MQRFRYRTAALVGRWRETPEQAVEDAITSRQAEREEVPPSKLRWRVPGFIEAED